jgi:peptidoglycan lytic transglycosylase G
VRRIQPQPPAPPAAPAGALDDETERPIGIRRVGRAARPVVTPPGDTPAGPARRRHGSIRRRLLGLFALALLAVVVIGALMLFQPLGRAEGARVQVTIPQGSSAREIGDQLADAGVVESGLLFSVRATLSGKREKLLSGRHTLNKDMTYGKAIAALSEPDVSAKAATISVTIPEGLSRREIALISKRAGLKGDYLDASKRFKGALNPFRYGAPAGTRSLEGFLFPATYELRRGAPARDLVDRQLAAFRQKFAGVDLTRARSKQLTAYDVLIIASMVEREAQQARERPLIAAVIYNRLKDGIPLGIDATTRYVLNKPSGALTRSELQIDSPYNTRKRAGLPPTPIGNPGLASIRAAAAPANVRYRYFVVKPGTCVEHAFSNSYSQFQQDSARYNAARAQAGGKSPTTC